jgi:hypothetical protein
MEDNVVVVSNAGTTAVNGNYIKEDSQRNGYDSWAHEDGTYYLCKVDMDGVYVYTINNDPTTSGVDIFTDVFYYNRESETATTVPTRIGDWRTFSPATDPKPTIKWEATGGIGTRHIKTDYPSTEGTVARITKQEGKQMNLTPSEGSIVPKREREGF